MILWVGASASPQVLKDLLNVDDVMLVDIHIVRSYVYISETHC